jgi:hypothetical protein
MIAFLKRFSWIPTPPRPGLVRCEGCKRWFVPDLIECSGLCVECEREEAELEETSWSC